VFTATSVVDVGLDERDKGVLFNIGVSSSTLNDAGMGWD
jgi:hypothetical protein